MNYNESADQKQYDKYKKTLGKEAPKKFEDFQNIKYFEPEKYADLKDYSRYKSNNPDSPRCFFDANKRMKALHDEKKIRTTGTLVAPPKGRVIETYNKHAEARFAERKFSKELAQDIVKNADFAIKQRKGTQYAFYSSKGFVALQNNGVVGSLGKLDEGGELLYKEVMKIVKPK